MNVEEILFEVSEALRFPVLTLAVLAPAVVPIAVCAPVPDGVDPSDSGRVTLAGAVEQPGGEELEAARDAPRRGALGRGVRRLRRLHLLAAADRAHPLGRRLRADGFG